MKIIISLIAFISSVCVTMAQQVNNSTINLIGNNSTVLITQSGLGYHTINMTIIGNSIPVVINQSGSINRTFNLTYECLFNCAQNPIIVNQY
jgi:hypothetical protein